nr:alcohol dehydrogenase [Raoultella sp. NCTC 9187]
MPVSLKNKLIRSSVQPLWPPLTLESLSQKMAVAESGMGIIEDKVIKNHFASEYIYNAYKDEKTCGILSEDDTFGTITIAEPIGIICGIVPTTNPTSTAIFKSLISLKTRNAIIFSPHPRAKDATNKAADIVLQAAIGCRRTERPDRLDRPAFR